MAKLFPSNFATQNPFSSRGASKGRRERLSAAKTTEKEVEPTDYHTEPIWVSEEKGWTEVWTVGPMKPTDHQLRVGVRLFPLQCGACLKLIF